MDLDKLYSKYASKSPIRPPKPEKEVTVDVPVAPSELEDKWVKLLQDSESLDPLTEKPAESPATLLKKLTEDEPSSDVPEYEKELLKALQPEYKEQKLAPDAATIPPPGKKADFTPDTLLKMCSQYYDLCRKF